MNQTEKIAQSRLPNKKNIDKTKMSFAPQSALTGEIKIDFNKLQAFRGKQMSKISAYANGQSIPDDNN